MIPYEKVTDEMVKSFAKNASFTRLVVAQLNIREALDKIQYTIDENRSDMKMFRHTNLYAQTEEHGSRLIDKKMRISRCFDLVNAEINKRQVAR